MPVQQQPLPLSQRARALAADVFALDPPRLAHSESAARQAAKACSRLNRQDADLIIAAAWLHDIGYADSLKTTGFHPVDGALALIRLDWPDRVVRLVAHHGGATLEAPYYSVAHHLGVIDAVPGVPPEILIYADMTSSPTGALVTPAERIEGMRSGLADSPVPAEVSEERLSHLLRTANAMASRIDR